MPHRIETRQRDHDSPRIAKRARLSLSGTELALDEFDRSMKTTRRRTRPPTGFIPLKDLAPRNDPKGGAARKAVFGERPPVSGTDGEQPRPDVEVQAERRQKPAQDRNRKKGEPT